MTSQIGPDQPPLYFKPTYVLPDQGPLIADPSICPERERAGVDRLSGLNGVLQCIRAWYYVIYNLTKRIEHAYIIKGSFVLFFHTFPHQ